MRILHAICDLDASLGGPMTALLGLASAQQARGDAVTVFATLRGRPGAAPGGGAAGDGLRDALGRTGCRVVTVGPARTPFAWHPRTKGVLAELVRATDVVHLHGVWEHFVPAAAAAASAATIPFFIRPCGLLSPYSLALKPRRKRLVLALYLRELLSRRAYVHCTSDAEAADVATLVAGARTVVVPNGTDAAARAGEFSAAAARRQFAALPAGPYAVFLGRLDRKKNVDVLVEALARCAERDLELAIVGPDAGGALASLRDLAARLGVAERVHFLGGVWGDARFHILKGARFLVLPSAHENFGIVLVEALACGVPVIMAEGLDLAGPIVAAGLGEAVPAGPGPLAVAMAAWAADPRRGAAVADAGPAFVEARFSWPAIAARWAALYAGSAPRDRL